MDVEINQNGYRPFVIFAEGTTSNSRGLLPFKAGGFAGMRSVVPTFLDWSLGQVWPFYDTVEFGPMCILLMSSISFTVLTVNVMPEFTPNTVMLEKHADKGKEPWEIFAWCVRDSISKHGNVRKVETNHA